MHFRQLPDIVVRTARAIGEEAAGDGIRLFVFGSFARGDARRTSDLDLGFEVDPGKPEAAVHALRERVSRLPTFRPVDLVDFRVVSPAFQRLASRCVVPLWERG